MLLPLILAEWELPLDSTVARSAPATARIPAHFGDKEQTLLARAVDLGGEFAVVFVRVEDEEDEANWTPLKTFDAQELPWPLLQPLGEWSDVIENSDYGRVVWFGGAMAVLHPDGRGNWRIPETREEVPFCWHDGAHDWGPVPAHEWKAALEFELQNPESDASFALTWAFLSERQRREIVWECEGGWYNFHNLLCWMLTAQSDLEQEQSYAIRVLCLNSHSDYYGLEFWFEEWINGEYTDKRVPWIVDWENTINSLFPIRSRRELIERYSCAKAQFPLNRAHAFMVERGPISYHEKVEALLHLREWARPRGIQMLPDKMERFDLEAWELMPSAFEWREGFATVCLRANWLGKEQEFLLRQVEMAPEWYVVFARSRDGSWPGHFALCASDDEDQPFTARSWKRTELAPLWEAFIECAFLARLFFLDFSRWGGRGHGSITLHANGNGCLEYEGEEAIFRWESAELERVASRHWLAQLEKELDEPDSDVRFALSWAQVTHDERANSLFRCERGTIDDLRGILLLAMHCDPLFAQKISLRKFPSLDQRQWYWNVWPVEQFGESYNPVSSILPTNLRLWGQAVIAWFVPSLDEELIRTYSCVFHFYERYKESLLQVSVSPLDPSAQEKARHLLREWARGKVLDKLLETLF